MKPDRTAPAKGALLAATAAVALLLVPHSGAQQQGGLQVSLGTLPEGWTSRHTSEIYEGGVLELHAPGDYFKGTATVTVTTETPAAFARMLQDIGAGVPPETGVVNFRVSEVSFHGIPALRYQFDQPPMPEIEFQGQFQEGFLFETAGHYIFVSGIVAGPSIERWTEEMRQAFAALRFPGGTIGGQVATPGWVPGTAPAWTAWLPTVSPGLGGIGPLPGPETLAQALVGILAPGVLAAILGALGGVRSPWANDGGFGLGFGGGSHVLSDGRTYHDGQRYTFGDGVEYVMRNGELHPLRSLQDGERFTDPDGSRRIWKGGQAWMETDWEQQAAATDRYARQHAADWAEESARLNPELVELNRQWDEKMKWLDNLHTMERGVLYGNEEMDVLRQRGEPGDFRGKIEELIGTFQETGEMDRETYSRMQRIYGMARRGDILDASAAHTEAEIFANTMREGMERMAHEVVRGADMEGNRSYKSMAVRMLANVLTVGQAELIYTPANSVYTMKEAVERGASTWDIAVQIGSDLAWGEVYGRVFGHGTQYAGKYAGKYAGQLGKKVAGVAHGRCPKLTRHVTEKVRTTVKTLTKKRRSPFAAKTQPPPNIPPKVSPGAGRVAKPAKPAPPTAPATRKQRHQSWGEAKKQGRSKVDAYEKAMKSGDPEQIRKAALDVQGDKQALWEINRRGDHLKRGMNKQMGTIYDEADKATMERLAKKYGIDPKDIEVYAPTNPAKNVKVGADRDITYRMRAKTGDVIPVGDPKNPARMTYRKVKPGEVAWVDVSYADAQSIYNEEFYKAAGGPVYAPDMNPAQFAEHMDQLVTNRLHAEAYGRYSGDLRTAINRPSRMFSDPQQVGQAMGYKADHWYQASSKIRGVDPGRAETFMAEGMRQTTKQYRNQVGRRAAVLRRAHRRFPNGGYDVKLDPKLEKAVSIMSLPETHGVAPSTVEAMLQKMGYTPSQVSSEVGLVVEMMQKLGPIK